MIPNVRAVKGRKRPDADIGRRLLLREHILW